jgi:hypothetical protein
MSRLWTWSVIAFWALAMGLLFRDKVMPRMLQVYYPTYAEGLDHLDEEDSQMGIFVQLPDRELRVGTSRRSVSPWQPTHPEDAAFSITDETTLDGSALRLPLGEFMLRTTTLLDTRYRVKSYDVIITSIAGNCTLSGVRRSDTEIEFLVTLFGSPPEKRTVTFDSSTSLASGLSPLQPPAHLRIGREWTVNRIDPLSLIVEQKLTTKPVIARVERMERIKCLGEEWDTFVISLRGDRYEALAWVDEKGRILQEKVPGGVGPLIMRREPVPEHAK